MWPALHELLLAQLRALGKLDFGPLRGGGLARASPPQGDAVGPSPVDRGRPGSKHHLIVDAGGIPQAVTLTGGNRNDVT